MIMHALNLVLLTMLAVSLVTLVIPPLRRRALREAMAMYDALPGPHWVKIGIIALCLAIPGPQDELLLIAILATCRYLRSRRNR